MATLAAPRRLLASLPVRFDDIGFWPRAALGLLLRGLALSGSWLMLRQVLTSVVASIYTAFGGTVVLQGGTTLFADRHVVDITVSCTQIEVLLFLVPLVWNRNRPFARELSFLLGLVALTAVLAVGRLLLALTLYHHGISWALGHDVPLGIAYALLFIVVLRRNAWVAK